MCTAPLATDVTYQTTPVTQGSLPDPSGLISRPQTEEDNCFPLSLLSLSLSLKHLWPIAPFLSSLTRPSIGCHICGSLEHKRRDCPEKHQKKQKLTTTTTLRKRKRLGTLRLGRVPTYRAPDHCRSRHGKMKTKRLKLAL